MSGQTISDRLTAAKHSISGQGLAKAVCKATTEEVMGPKKKHLDYLIQCTHEPNVSIPQLANLLIERAQTGNWVTVFKSLVTLHNLMNYGNERFTQYLASNNCTLNLSNFIDKTGVQGYDMSTYVRRYAKYINEKAYAYRSMAFDFCKVKRGKQDGLLRTMNAEKLLKTIPPLQHQLDVLVEFDVTANELTNGVVNAAFMLLFKDLIRLFACYNDGIINLLEKFFDMQKKQCREALEIYKRFLARMERCAEFLKVAESVGIDKGDIPDLAKAPSSLLEALEEHLKALEGQKKSKTDKPGGGKPAVAAGITQLQSPTSPSGAGLSDEEKRRIIEEENKQLEKLKQEQKVIEQKVASPVLAASRPVAAAEAAPPAAVKASDDLLGLGFAGQSSAGFNAAPAGSGVGFNAAPAGSGAPVNNPFGGPAPMSQPAMAAPNSWSAPPPGFDSFGGILTPQNTAVPAQNNIQPTSTTTAPKLIQNDIDSSLASLAGNLTVGAGQIKTQQQWNKPTEKKMTGGSHWQNPSMASSTMAPMNQSAGMYNGPMQPAQHQYYQVAPSHGYMNGQPLGYGNVPSQPIGMQPMGMGMQPMGAMYGGAPAMGAQPMYGQPRPPMQQQQPLQNNPQDPFGAL